MQNQPLVQAKDLTIGYGREVIVPDMQCHITAGSSWALVGMNGSGKSTYLKTLAGLLPVLSGMLTVFGRQPGKSPLQVSYLSQFHTNEMILPLRVVDTVMMGRFALRGLLGRMTSEDDDIVHESLKRLEIEPLREVPLRSLSGGQQQRVYLAQVLAKQARLLLLDEPTTSLDAVGLDLYKKITSEELAKGNSIVVATHSIHEARTCTHTMLLARKVIACGHSADVLTPENLMETFGRVFEH